MLRCENCGALFHDTVSMRDELDYRYSVCPICGSPEWEEQRRCPICGVWMSETEDVCTSCRERIVNGVREVLTGLRIISDSGRRAAVDVVADWVEAQ